MTRTVARPGGARLARSASALLAVLVTASALAACSPQDLIEDAAQNAAEEVVQGQTGEDVDIETGGELAEGFPSDVIPLVDGEITSSVATDTGTGTAWIVLVTVEGSTTEDATNAARDLLIGSGFAEPEAMAGLGMAILEKEGYQVLLSSSEQNGSAVVNYTVTQG